MIRAERGANVRAFRTEVDRQAGEEARQAVNFSRPELALRVAAGVAAALVAVKLADFGLVWLNAHERVLPQFDVRLIPYHDPRFTKRDALLRRYRPPPRVIFTGDSRTKNGFDPEVIARELGVEPALFFNFGTGSQVLRFAREAFVPHLVEMGVRPRYLVFGITPEHLLNRAIGRVLLEKYRSSLAFRMSHPEPGGDRVERGLSFFLARHLALYRYRGDLVERELVPDLRCWFRRQCDETTQGVSAPFKRIELLDGWITPYGWNPQAWDALLPGDFVGRPRFSERDPVDRQGLTGLIGQVREAGMTPVFIEMPLHPSFWAAHEPALSRIFAVLEEVAAAEGAGVIRPKGDYRDPALFVDGHHLSRRGAAYFSAQIARDLAPYVRDGN